MNYTNDETYQQHLETLEDDLIQLTKKIKTDSSEAIDQGEAIKDEIQTKLNKQREKATQHYHATLAYLKEKFGVDSDEVLKHKMQSALHQVKAAGYKLKEDILG